MVIIICYHSRRKLTPCPCVVIQVSVYCHLLSLPSGTSKKSFQKHPNIFCLSLLKGIVTSALYAVAHWTLIILLGEYNTNIIPILQMSKMRLRRKAGGATLLTGDGASIPTQVCSNLKPTLLTSVLYYLKISGVSQGFNSHIYWRNFGIYIWGIFSRTLDQRRPNMPSLQLKELSCHFLAKRRGWPILASQKAQVKRTSEIHLFKFLILHMKKLGSQKGMALPRVTYRGFKW